MSWRKRKLLRMNADGEIEGVNEPPLKRSKQDEQQTQDPNEKWIQCTECKEYRLPHHLFNIAKYEDICYNCLCSEKYKQDKEIWKSNTLRSTKSDILQQCNLRHRQHIDKLKLTSFCIPCLGFVNEREKYLNAINTAQILKPMKYLLLSFLIHSKIEYYTKRGFPKYQIILDEWYRYTVNNNSLQKSIKILKTMMSKLNMEAFMDLLCQLQPWMNCDNLWSIIEYQSQNNHCNGCSALDRTGNQCWICHMAVKAIFLIYFCIDLYTDYVRIWNACCNYMYSHMGHNCCWFWNIGREYRYIQLFGHHVVKGHVINKMRDNEVEEEDSYKPPIITKDMLNKVQYNMMKEVRNGWKWVTTYQIAQNTPQAVWLANEVGKTEYITL